MNKRRREEDLPQSCTELCCPSDSHGEHGGRVARMFHTSCFLLFVFILSFASCVGIEADIQMRKDGSAKVVLEYRFSRMAETIGKMDGNENWPIVPVGREDWKRTEQRVDGMKVVSFSSKQDARDIINKVTLDFKTADALLKFLDPTGRRASLKSEGGQNKLHLTLNERSSAQLNEELLKLLKEACAGYSVLIKFSAATQCALNFTDAAGNLLTITPATSFSSGKKASVSIHTEEIFSSEKGLGLDLIWK